MLAACKDGKKEAVEKLISEGEDLDEADEFGQTGLMWAIRGGHEGIVKLLVDSKADVNYKGSVGSALDIAEEEGQEDMAQILKDAGATEGEDMEADGAEGDDWGDGGGGEGGGEWGDGDDNDEEGWGNEGVDVEGEDNPGEWPAEQGEDPNDSIGFVAKIQEYYTADQVKNSDPAEALKKYRECVEGYEEWKKKSESGETSAELDDETVGLVLKALVAQVGIFLAMGEEKEAFDTFESVFTFVHHANISESDFRSAVLGVLNNAMGLRQSDKKMARATMTLYDKTLEKLQELGNATLWDEVTFKLSSLYTAEGDLKNAERVLDKVHEKCMINGHDDLSKPDQLCEIYARRAKIRIMLGNEDDSFLNYIYSKTHELKTNVTDPKNESVLKECWGKKFGNEGHWETAYTQFFTAFKNYQTVGESTDAKRCLKYAVMTNMLCDKAENPFEQQEARVYKTDPQIKAINSLRDAYEKCDVDSFKTSTDNLQPDRYMKKHLGTMVRDFQERAICDLIRPYQRVRVAYICKSIGVDSESALDILIQLILDGKVNGRINEVEGILDLRKSNAKRQAIELSKYKALESWATSLDSMRKTMPQPESRRGVGLGASKEFMDMPTGSGHTGYDFYGHHSAGRGLFGDE